MRLVQRITGTFALRGLSAFGSLALAALIVDLYSLERFGIFSFALLTTRVIAALLLFSLDSLLLRLLLRATGDSYRKGANRITQETSGLAMVFSLAGLLVIAGVTAIAIALVPEGGFWTSLLLLAPLIVTQNITSMQASVLRSRRRDVLTQWVTVGIVSLLPLAAIASARLLGNPHAYLPELAIIAASLISAVIGAQHSGLQPLRHIGRGIASMRRGSWRILRYSSAVHSANVMNYISDWFGAMLVSSTQSFAMTGALRIIQQIGSAFQLVSASLEIPFSSEIAQAQIARQTKRLRTLLRSSQLALGAMGLVLCASILLTAQFFLPLFDANTADVRMALLIYVLLLTANFCNGAASSALSLMDATRRLIRASAIALVLTIVLQCLLVPLFGIVGAAAALGLGALVRGTTNYWFVRRELAEMERRKLGEL